MKNVSMKTLLGGCSVEVGANYTLQGTSSLAPIFGAAEAIISPNLGASTLCLLAMD